MVGTQYLYKTDVILFVPMIVIGPPIFTFKNF